MNHPPQGLRLLDDLDRQLLACLKADPRALNTALATQLAVTEATVATRIRALEADGAMRVSAQRDFRAAGFEVLANIDVQVAGRAVGEVAADIARLPQIAIVTTLMGSPAIMLLAMAASVADLQEVVLSVGHVPGVAGIETMLISEVLKFQSEFASLSRRVAA